MEHVLTDRSNDFFIKTAFRRYLFPSILSVLGYTLSILINNIIVGNLLGDKALAAMNLVSPIQFTYATLGSLICVGGSISASYFIGKQDKEGSNSVFTISLILSLLGSILLTSLGILFLEDLMFLVGAEGQLYQMAYDYALIIILGGVSVVLIYFPFNFLRVDGRPQLGVLMFFLMAASNIVLDFYFINLGKGIAGIALATVISNFVAVIVGVSFLFSKSDSFKFIRPRKFIKSSREIASLGSSMALNNLCNIVRTVVINRLLFGTYGESAVAVFALLASVNQFSLAIISGVAQTITPLTGVFYSERDNTSIRMTLKQAFVTGTALITILALILSLFAGPIVRLFGITEGVFFDNAIYALIFFNISLIFAMLNNIFIFHFFTTGHVAISNIMTLGRGFVFVVAFMGVLSLLRQERLIWIGFALAEIATIIVMIAMVELVSNTNKNLSRLYLLDETYEKNGKYISFSIANDLADIVDASTKISSFCEENSLSARLSMMISLSLEEMLISISEHCFKEGEKQYIDIRIFVYEDDIILRMRNGGLLFDPIAYYENRARSMSEEELAFDDSLGIGLIVKNTKAVYFNRTFGFNNLTIQL